MDDLILRRQAIDAIGEKSDEIYKTKQKGATYPHDDFFQGMAYAENVVKQLPSAQPEIIRCRECKFASGDSRICMKLGHSPIGELDFVHGQKGEPMDDTISRQAAIDKILGQPPEPHYPSWYAEQIKELPPAQPDLSEYSDKLWQKAYERGKAEAQAEIVRCKDCRFNTYSKKCLNPDSFFLVPADDFYCGYAERRTNE